MFNKNRYSKGIQDFLDSLKSVVNNKDWVFFPGNLGVSVKKSCLIVHDLIGIRSDYDETFIKKIIRRIALYVSLRNATIIISPSSTIKMQIIKKYPFTYNKIHTILNGYDFPENIRVSKPVPIKIIDSNFLLIVSNSLPHKGLNSFLNIYNKQFHPNSIIVGRLSAAHSQLCHDKCILNISEATDGEMRWLYENCDYFVSTSLDEGFGIPAAICYSLGKPMIIRDIPVYRELFPESVDFFTNDSDLDQLLKLIDKPRRHFRSVQWTWSSCRDQYEKILGC